MLQCLTKGETSSDIKFSSRKKLLHLSLIFFLSKAIILTNLSSLIGYQVIKRFTLQRLRAAELLEFWLDVSHLGVGSEQHEQQAAITAFQSLKGLLQAVMQLEVGIRDTGYGWCCTGQAVEK